MNSYKWYGRNQSGNLVNGEINAFSPKLAKFNLQQQGIHPKFVFKKINFFTNKHFVSVLDITLFFRQLSTLVSSGIPLLQSFILLSKLQNKTHLKSTLNAITNDIESGKNLSASFKKFPKYFDALTCYMIDLGEQTGQLDKMLFRISIIKEKSYSTKKTMHKALIYPCVTSIVALAIVIFMLVFVIPHFQDLFINMHSSLPWITLFIINISHFLINYYYLLFIPTFILFCSYFYLKKLPTFNKLANQCCLYFPLIGSFYKKILLTRFVNSLATTFSAGLPILESLPLIANTVGNSLFVKELLKLQNQIALGKSLFTAMGEQEFFPVMMVSLIKIGEETGKLDLMLEKISTIYENDVANSLSHINTLLEPLIILILGVLIGVVIIAMYLPIFKLGTVI